MKFTRNQIDDLIQYLQGSCDSLSDGIFAVIGEDYSEDDLSLDNLEQIDNEIFLCDVCGWWFEVCEMSESESEQACVECNNE